MTDKMTDFYYDDPYCKKSNTLYIKRRYSLEQITARRVQVKKTKAAS